MYTKMQRYHVLKLLIIIQLYTCTDRNTYKHYDFYHIILLLLKILMTNALSHLYK